MLYIATVHHHVQSWVGIQARFIMANTNVHFKIFSVCNGVEPGLLTKLGKVFRTKFRSTGAQNHAENLNLLGHEILREAHSGDRIIFMDSDAFPVSPEWLPQLDTWLWETPLAAVKRDGGPSPLIPHPLFCATTADFWKCIKGDWIPAPYKLGNGTMINDTGSKLYKRLAERGIAWHAIHKTNRAFEPHSTNFSLYGDLIYHHGAASRTDYPDVNSGGGTCLCVRLLSDIMLRLIEDHSDFYKIFTEGKYLDAVKKVAYSRGIPDELFRTYAKETHPERD